MTNKAKLLTLAVLALGALRANALEAVFSDNSGNAEGQTVLIFKEESAEESQIKGVDVRNHALTDDEIRVYKKKLWLKKHGAWKKYALCWKGKPRHPGKPIKEAKILPKTTCKLAASRKPYAPGKKAEFKVVPGSLPSQAGADATLKLELKETSKDAAADAAPTEKKGEVVIDGDGNAFPASADVLVVEDDEREETEE